MSTLNLVLAALFIVISVSWAWGMRGDLIGGEEGAMLPGALLGMGISLFLGGSDTDNVLFMMGFGMIGMFFGGTETYAQTLDLIRWGDGGSPKSENAPKGIFGLMVKGAPWFGVCCGVIAIGINALAGRCYRWYELIAIPVALLLLRWIGIKIFNSPFNPEKGKLPKIYFSKDRHEEWGGLWLMLIGILVYTFIKRDRLGFTMPLFGAAGGSIGWVIAELLDCATRAKKKNGKYVFGSLQEKGYIDNWKIMEFAYGALASLAVVAGLIFNLPVLRICSNMIAKYGVYYFINLRLGYFISLGFTVLVTVLLFLYPVLSHFVKHKHRKARKIIRKFKRPVLCCIPLIMLYLKDFRIARIMVVVILPFLALEELVFVNMRHNHKKTSTWEALSITALILGMLLVFLSERYYFNITAVYVWLFAVYFAAASAASFNTQRKISGRRKAKAGVLLWDMPSFKTVKGYYIVCFVITAALYVICSRG